MKGFDINTNHVEPSLENIVVQHNPNDPISLLNIGREYRIITMSMNLFTRTTLKVIS